MSNNINVTVLSGRVCADAELKYTSAAMAVSNFSIAVNKYRSTPDGQGKEEVSYFNCTMFGKSAESFSPKLLKGVPVIVNGELKQDRWEGQDGKTQSKVSLIVNRVELIYTGNGQQSSQNASPNHTQNPYMYSTPPAQQPSQQIQPSQYTAPPYQQPPQMQYKAPSGAQYPQAQRTYQAPPTNNQTGLRPQDGQPYMMGPESFADDSIPF